MVSWKKGIQIAAAVLVALAFAGGCGEEPSAPTAAETTGATTQTATVPPYQRRAIDFFQGIAEPRADAWEDMTRETDRILGDGFNTVSLLPPVLTTERLGGKPRVIAEGQAALAEDSIDSFHEKGLAVYVAPTTRVAGFSEQVEPTEAALGHLTEDAVRWAGKAEDRQAELFAPLSRYNLVLGTDAANKWSAGTLPLVREKYHGPLAVEAVPDLVNAPPPGQIHDFERLDFRGYDYLLLDFFPHGGVSNASAFEYYVADVLDRANAVAQRDGLKGVMIGELGCWREPAGADTVDGPLFNGAEQADLARRALDSALPRTRGVFWYGWTLPGRGARDFPVEDELKKRFTPPPT